MHDRHAVDLQVADLQAARVVDRALGAVLGVADAGGRVGHVVQRLHVLVQDLLLRDHGDCLGRFPLCQRQAGGHATGAGGGVAGGALGHAIEFRRGLDGDFLQGGAVAAAADRCRRVARHHGQGAAGGHGQLQAAAGQGALRGLLGAQCAHHGGCLLTGQQRGVGTDAAAAFAGDARQGVAQRAGGQIPLQHGCAAGRGRRGGLCVGERGLGQQAPCQSQHQGRVAVGRRAGGKRCERRRERCNHGADHPCEGNEKKTGSLVCPTGWDKTLTKWKIFFKRQWCASPPGRPAAVAGGCRAGTSGAPRGNPLRCTGAVRPWLQVRGGARSISVSHWPQWRTRMGWVSTRSWSTCRGCSSANTPKMRSCAASGLMRSSPGW